MTTTNPDIKNRDVLLSAFILFSLLCIIENGYRLWYMWGYPPINKLMIDETPFPSGWIAEEIDTDFLPLAPCSTGREEIEYAHRGFYFDPPSGYVGGASITLQRFRSPSVASKNFNKTASHAFRDTDWNTPWIIPEELEFTSLTANQYQYACSLEGDPSLAKPVCTLIARYEVYLIEVYIGLYDITTFTYEDIIPIFEAIDQKMSHLR